MTKRWDEVIVEVQDLVRKGKPLTEIMRLMEARGFKASRRSYREKIKEWGLKRKTGNRAQRIARQNVNVPVPESSIDSATWNSTSFVFWSDIIMRADPLEFTKLVNVTKLNESTLIGSPLGEQILDTHLFWSSHASLLQLIIVFGSADLLVAFHQFHDITGLSCRCLCGCHAHRKVDPIFISLSHFAVICCKPEMLSKLQDLLGVIDYYPDLAPSCLSKQSSLYHSMNAQSSEASVSITRLLLNFGQRLDSNEPAILSVFKYAHLKAGTAQQRRLRKIKIYFEKNPEGSLSQAMAFLADLNSDICKTEGVNRLEQDIFCLILKTQDLTVQSGVDSGKGLLCTDESHNDLLHWTVHHTPQSGLTDLLIEWCSTENEEQLPSILLELLRPCPNSEYYLSNMVISPDDSRSSKTVFGPIGNHFLRVLDKILKMPTMVPPLWPLSHSHIIERSFDERLALEIARLILGSLTVSDTRRVFQRYKLYCPISTNWEFYRENLRILPNRTEVLFARAALDISTSRFLDAEFEKEIMLIEVDSVLGAIKARADNGLSRYELPPEFEELMAIHCETSRQSLQQRDAVIEQMAFLIKMASLRPHAPVVRQGLQGLLNSTHGTLSQSAINNIEELLVSMEPVQSYVAEIHGLPVPQSLRSPNGS